jgi:hypothetical protein
MRKPSALSPWFTPTQLAAWVQEAPDKGAYQRRLAIWLTQAGPFAAHRVAELLAVSTQAAWKWLGEYNALGPQGLERHGRGGRRWRFLTLDQERLPRREVEPGRIRRPAHRPTTSSGALGSRGAGSLSRLRLRLAASPSVAKVGSASPPRPARSGVGGSLQKQLPNTLETIAQSLPEAPRCASRFKTKVSVRRRPP